MSRSTSNKKKSVGKSGGNRQVMLALAGFTALVIAALVGFAVLGTARPSDDATGSFTPNAAGLIQPREQAPQFTASTVDGSKVVGAHAGEVPEGVYERWIEKSL